MEQELSVFEDQEKERRREVKLGNAYTATTTLRRDGWTSNAVSRTTS